MTRKTRADFESWIVPAGKRGELAEGMRFASPPKTMTDAHYLSFSAISGDVHPIHYDVEYAKTTRFDKPVAHGLLLSSLTATGASVGAPYMSGVVLIEQGCRYFKHVVVGDTLSPFWEVERIWSDGDKRYLRAATTIFNQRDEVVLEGFHVYRFVREP